MIVLLIVLPIFLFATFSVVSFTLFVNKQAKLETVHNRALELVQQEGYLSQEIINDTTDKLENIGFPPVVVNGIEYPSFTGSTNAKTLKDDEDPSVTLSIKYPATDIQKMLSLIGGNETEKTPGFFHIKGFGRSEAYE